MIIYHDAHTQPVPLFNPHKAFCLSYDFARSRTTIRHIKIPSSLARCTSPLYKLYHEASSRGAHLDRRLQLQFKAPQILPRPLRFLRHAVFHRVHLWTFELSAGIATRRAGQHLSKVIEGDICLFL